MTASVRRAVSLVVLGVTLSPGVSRGQDKYAPPADVRFRTADIVSEGTRMTAEVFAPAAAGDRKLPTIIQCHGWGGVARDLRPEAVAFARAGFLAVVFDYRGWGASDARLVPAEPLPAGRPAAGFAAKVKEVREVVDPLDQTTDLLNAVHWAAGEPQCDPARIGLWGSSYSGGHVVYAAARDKRVKATVSQVPALDSRWVLAGPGREQTLRDATRRARGEAGYPAPGEQNLPNLRGAPIRERLMNYAPVEDVEKAAHCATLFVVAEKEELFDNRDHGIKAYDRAKGPKKLVTLPGIKHYGVYNEARPQAQKLAIEWFTEHLAGAKPAAGGGGADDKDWPSYNRDAAGTRFARGETAISASNAGTLVEKWRFPAKGARLEIGVVHATPIVVGGCVYFGTASDSAFYKLAPDGTLKWVYRNPTRPPPPPPADEAARRARFQSSPNGVLASALVAADTVYFVDIGGWVYALDRETGKERWTLNTRGPDFPGPHPLNCLFASPVLADGKLIVAGGTLEQVVAAFPGYKGCTGRGFVMALDPATGKVAWKYDVGPKPEKLDPPLKITDSWGDHLFYFGPATSSIWSTPSFDPESGTIYFGTDVNTAPRRPTPDNPRLDTPESCGIVALSVKDGTPRWATQISPGDVWTNAMRAYDPATGRYKDQSIGDTPKVYTIAVDGKPTKVVGCGCKNGGFYVLIAADGKVVAHTPIYTGPPAYPLSPTPDPRTLALPSLIGGLQTGCATDGVTVYTNGIDAVRMAAQEKPEDGAIPPTAGRVVAISTDTRTEKWRHERPKLASLGGPKPKPMYTDVGDPVASGLAVANGVVYFTTVASGKLVAVDAATGSVLKEIDLGPVWSGPSVSRGRVYVGTGNTLFNPYDFEAYFPKKATGVVYSFGLPGDDEVSRLGAGR